jgi:hypothetical protein
VSTDAQLLREIKQDLQASSGRGVVYLEGATDPAIFFALLGVDAPLAVDRDTFAHEGVLVRGLPGTSGSGSSAAT